MEGAEDQLGTQVEPHQQVLDDNITQHPKNQSTQTEEAGAVNKTDEDENKIKDSKDLVHIEQDNWNQIGIDLQRAIQENDPQWMTEIAQKIKTDFSKDKNSFPTEQILKNDIIETLVTFLKKEKAQDQAQIYESLGVLAQISSEKGVVIDKLVELGMIEIASGFLKHEDFGIIENALNLLANIAQTSFGYRDDIIEREYNNIVGFVESKCKSQVSPSFDVCLSLFLMSLFRGSPYLSFKKLKPFLPTVQDLLLRKESEEVKLNCLIFLNAFCTDAPEGQIDKLLDIGCIKYISTFVDYSNSDWKIVDWALRVIGSLSDQQFRKLLDIGLIEKIEDLLYHDEEEMKKTAAWAFSNILVSGKECTEAVFEYKEGNIIRKIFQMIRTEKMKIAKECIYCLTNVCLDRNENYDKIIELVQRFPFVETIVDFLRRNKESERMVGECLEAFEKLLSESKKTDSKLYEIKDLLLNELESCGGYVMIKSFKNDPRVSLREPSLRIIQNHFSHNP